MHSPRGVEVVREPWGAAWAVLCTSGGSFLPWRETPLAPNVGSWQARTEPFRNLDAGPPLAVLSLDMRSSAFTTPPLCCAPSPLGRPLVPRLRHGCGLRMPLEMMSTRLMRL